MRFVDPADPGRGLLFDGQIAEDFQLTSGTWVLVGVLRTALVSAGLLSVPSSPATTRPRGRAGPAHRPGRDLTEDQLRARVGAALTELNRGQGSSGRIERLLLLDAPPDLAAGEITDEG